MKVDFIQGSDNYLGDYYSEYRRNGLMKPASISKTLKDRESDALIENNDDVISIGGNTKLQEFLKYAKAENKELSMLNKFVNYRTEDDIIVPKTFRFLKEDIEDIQDTLNDFDSKLIEYAEDFALLFLFAKEYCYTLEEHDPRILMQNVFDKKEKQQIEKLFSSLTSIDIHNISISYDPLIPSKKNEYENISINSPILLKMMLYGFAREYFTHKFRLPNDPDVKWENYIIGDNITAGTPKDRCAAEKTAVVTTAYMFMRHLGIFASEVDTDENKDKRLYLIGKLLGEYFGYEYTQEAYVAYKSEKNYYSKLLKKKLKISRNLITPK